MSFYKELEYNDKNIDKVVGIQFGIMGPDEIRRRSVVEITETQTYQGNEPHPGGLFDPRMGVNEPDKKCPTDGLDGRFCPGYFGHIELVRPVFYIQYVEYVRKILNCICFRCSKLRVDKEKSPELRSILKRTPRGQKRFQEIEKLMSKVSRCGDKNCNGCNSKQPTYKLDSLAKIKATWKLDSRDSNSKITEMIFNAETVLKIFKRISDEDVEIMGFFKNWCRPDWMICQVLAVPPPAVRPSAKQDNNQRMEDDLTAKLIDILKANNSLKQKIETIGSNNSDKQMYIDTLTMLLQYHVAVFIDNELPGVSPSTQRSGRALKSIKQRLRSKEGRIRGNLMGKRVDFSARSVITPDPSIKVDQLGVPQKIAMNLTYPEIVSVYNKDKLQKYVNNGPLKYPGAKSVKIASQNFRAFSLEYVKKEINLEIGDIVNRHLVDDDIVLFNRQPSLHKMSMMAHKIKVMKYSTFRLNVSVTSPYNADFDGDEMNMHVPQSIQAQTELKSLVTVPMQIISPKQNKPVISIVQDTLLGVYRMTREGYTFNPKEYMNLVFRNNNYDCNIDNSIKEYSGHDILSTTLPCVNMSMGNEGYDDDEGHNSPNYVIIKNGIISKGVFDKAIYSKMSRGLVHIIYNDFGYNQAKDFLDNTQDIINKFLLYTGFSVGISDIVASNETKSKIKNSIAIKKNDVEKLIQQLHLNVFENKSGMSNSDMFELTVMKLLQAALDDIYKTTKNEIDQKTNRMLNMANSKSKGKPLNISQMVACLGQQVVDGKRVSLGFTDRTLPHFTKYDDGPDSRGFVNSSFMGGLNAQEFFFHAMGGREGLIDTAVKTSETGYIQRKLMKAMEDLKVVYDYSVRTASNSIVQFIYGEDSMDSIKVESQIINFTNLSYSEFNLKFNFNLNEQWNIFLEDNIVENINNDNSFKDTYNKYFSDLLNLRKIYIQDIKKNCSSDLEMVYFPVDISRKIKNYSKTIESSNDNKSDVSPLYVLDLINDILIQTKTKSIIFEILIKTLLCPVELLKFRRFSKKILDCLKLDIINSYENSLIEPGEMVGAIAAQSVGEPATQMTLNTFHQAGAGSGITMGVPRLRELLGVSKNPKGPSMNIFLQDSVCNDLEKSKEIMNELEITKLKNITISTKIYYDPDDLNTTLSEDDLFLNIYKEFNDIDNKCKSIESKKSDWLLRFEFDKSSLLNKNISMDEIYQSIMMVKNKDINCLYSDYNSKELIFRLRLNQSENDTDDISSLKSIEKELLEKTIIRGVEKINKITMRRCSDYGEIDDNNKFVTKSQWVLDTFGVNLRDVLSFPGVNPYKTTCNDIWEVYNVLGIEAARKALFLQIKTCIESSGGEYINYRHLYLLADIMTDKGTLMSIDRHGINRGDTGPLAKCSFEETTDQLLKASVFGQTDNVNGVSSNIMLGQVAPCGTGIPDVLFDEVEFSKLYGSYEFETIDEGDENIEDHEMNENDSVEDEFLEDNLKFDFNPNISSSTNLDYKNV